MAWTNLTTDYKDATWSGKRKFSITSNGDGTSGIEDVTEYTNKENSFFGASDANQMNAAMNGFMDGTYPVADSDKLGGQLPAHYATAKAAADAAAAAQNAQNTADNVRSAVDYTYYVADYAKSAAANAQTAAQTAQTAAQTAQNTAQTAQNTANGKTTKLEVYPVGAIYLSTASTSPASLFGGTWSQLTDRFLLAAGSTYAAGNTGGAATHTLNVNEMPSHNHVVYVRTTVAGDASYSVVQHTPGNGGSGNSLRVGDTLSAGGGAAHNNMPPYLVVYMWMRTA